MFRRVISLAAARTAVPTRCGVGALRRRKYRTIGRGIPSTRNLLDESSVAQCLDGEPSNGEPAYPRGRKLDRDRPDRNPMRALF
jgi:hypothetical protein